MKKGLILLLMMLLLVGCQTPEKPEVEVTPVVSLANANTASGLTTKQEEVVVEPQEIEQETSSESQTKTATSHVDLPKNGYNRIIVIDAGHQRYGNSEKEPIGPGASQTKAKVTTGATGVTTGTLESQINLDVAFKLQSKLEASGYTVIMVRTSQNVNISNSERAAIANQHNAAAFIRLHCNSDSSSSTTGTLTMAPSTSNPYCSQIASASQSLSRSVVNNICAQTGSKNRGVIITDTMSGINWCQVPVTIVEMGFLSNPNEERLLIDSSYQDKIVNGIVLGINEYLN